MRRFKPLLACLAVICILMSLSLPAFAVNTPPAPEVLNALGILGDGYKTDPTHYLSGGLTRLNAAELSLGLMGKLKEASAWTGTDKFTDFNVVGDPDVKAVLAFLKSHPELGWSGDSDSKFQPGDQLTAQAFYKVLLAALGYMQGTDFTWGEALTFAAQKGLTKLDSVKALTVNDFCTGAVEALNAKVKGGDTTLLEKLVAAGVYPSSALAYLQIPVIIAVTNPAPINTPAGTNPTLPATVTVTLSDKTTAQAAVTWGTVSANFTIHSEEYEGTVAGTNIKAHINVIWYNPQPVYPQQGQQQPIG